jgi:hypothetical protein
MECQISTARPQEPRFARPASCPKAPCEPWTTGIGITFSSGGSPYQAAVLTKQQTLTVSLHQDSSDMTSKSRMASATVSRSRTSFTDAALVALPWPIVGVVDGHHDTIGDSRHSHQRAHCTPDGADFVPPYLRG